MSHGGGVPPMHHTPPVHHSPPAHHSHHHGAPDPLIYPIAGNTGRGGVRSRAATVASALTVLAILAAIVLYLAIWG